MTIMKEEIFGPVIVIAKFKDTDDVIAKANNTEYGLGAGVFTSNITRAIKVSNALEAGTVCKLFLFFYYYPIANGAFFPWS